MTKIKRYEVLPFDGTDMRYEDDSASMILYKYLPPKHECKWTFALHLKDGHWKNKRWTLREQQSINTTGYVFIFFRKRRRKISEPLLTPNRVCIHCWQMLQGGNPHADPYKAKNYALNLPDVGELWSKHHYIFTLLLRSFLGKTLKLCADCAWLPHGQRSRSQRRSNQGMGIVDARYIIVNYFFPWSTHSVSKYKVLGTGETRPSSRRRLTDLQRGIAVLRNNM